MFVGGILMCGAALLFILLGGGIVGPVLGSMLLGTGCIVLAAVDITLAYLPGPIGGGVRSSVTAGRHRRATVGMAVVAVPIPMGALAVLVAAVGLGLGAGQPLAMSWLAASTPPGLRGRAMSLRLTGNRLGKVVVPGLAGILAVSAGASGVLVLTGGCLAAAGIAASRIRPSPVPTQHDHLRKGPDDHLGCRNGRPLRRVRRRAPVL